MRAEARLVAESDEGFDKRYSQFRQSAEDLPMAKGDGYLGAGERLVRREAEHGDEPAGDIGVPRPGEEWVRLDGVLLLRWGGKILVCDVKKRAPAAEPGSALDRLRERLGAGGALAPQVAEKVADTGADARTLPVRYDASGRRFMDYVECMAHRVRSRSTTGRSTGPAPSASTRISCADEAALRADITRSG